MKDREMSAEKDRLTTEHNLQLSELAHSQKLSKVKQKHNLEMQLKYATDDISREKAKADADITVSWISLYSILDFSTMLAYLTGAYTTDAYITDAYTTVFYTISTYATHTYTTNIPPLCLLRCIIYTAGDYTDSILY